MARSLRWTSADLERLPDDGSGAERYTLDVTTARAPVTWVRRSEEAGEAYGY